MDNNRPGKIMKRRTKGGFDQVLKPEVIVPDHAFEQWIENPDQNGSSEKLRIKPRAFGNAARNDGRNGRSKGQQEEELNKVIAA